MVKGKDGCSALDLQRQLGVGTYETAWAILQKLRRAIVVLGREKLNGMVEVDDARYRHTVHVQKGRRKDDPHRLPHVHRLIALVKRWLLGTHQDAVRPRHLDA